MVNMVAVQIIKVPDLMELIVREEDSQHTDKPRKKQDHFKHSQDEVKQ